MTTSHHPSPEPSTEPGGDLVPVTTLRRPPVRQSTLVRSDAAHTFAVFVTTIGTWWPVQSFSAGGDRVRDVTLEPRRGGRVYETWDDATEMEWGRLLVWEPPKRFVMTWNSTPVPTEVELTFTALGPALTRVAVEHRGWEALSDAQLAEDCSLPGGYSSRGYSQGWANILGCLITAAENPPTTPGGASTTIADERTKAGLGSTKSYTSGGSGWSGLDAGSVGLEDAAGDRRSPHAGQTGTVTIPSAAEAGYAHPCRVMTASTSDADP